MVRQLIYLSMMTVRKAEVVWCGVVSWWGDAMGSEDE
jgi:phage gp46-like protein